MFKSRPLATLIVTTGYQAAVSSGDYQLAQAIESIDAKWASKRQPYKDLKGVG